MKRRLLTMFYALMSGLGILRLFYRLNRPHRRHITFHNVLPDALLARSPHLGMCHPAGVFERQVELIARRIPRPALNEGPYGPLITFDDGYINQGEVAAPILEKYGARGLFFVPLEPIESGATLAVDQLRMWVSYVPAGTYELVGRSRRIDDTNRPATFNALYRELLERPDAWTTLPRALDRAFPREQLNVPDEVHRLRFVPLDGPALAALTERGHHVACHSWDHHPLSRLSPDVLQAQLRRCAEQHGTYCNDHGFSYPFGDIAEVDPAVARACRAAGFSHAFLNTPTRPAGYESLARFALPRITLPCHETNPHVLDAKLSGFETFLKRLLRRA